MSKNTKKKAVKVEAPETKKVEVAEVETPKVKESNFISFTPTTNIHWNREVEGGEVVKVLLKDTNYSLKKELVEKVGILKYNK